MNPLLIGLLAFIVLIVLLLLRVPIGISMLIVGAGGLFVTKALCWRNMPYPPPPSGRSPPLRWWRFPCLS